MSGYLRKRRNLRLPITMSVVLMSVNVILMVCWIVLLTQEYVWSAMTLGTIAFAISLFGLSFYLVLTVKAVRLNQRQSNFVDSVTHELKSPIAALKLYLETLQMRPLDEEQRREFYKVMGGELQRLDHLIDHLLEVARLDAIGHRGEAEDVPLTPLLHRCAHNACANHQCDAAQVVAFDVEPAVINARQMVLEMIFGNLLDNAVKYAGTPPHVSVQVRVRNRGRVIVRIVDNGEGVPHEIRKKIFGIFYRGGSELERTRKGTGLGLYIVRTLVHLLRGRVHVYDREGENGSVFEVDLPGRVAA